VHGRQVGVVEHHEAADAQLRGGQVPVQRRKREAVSAVDQHEVQRLGLPRSDQRGIRRLGDEAQAVGRDPVLGAVLHDAAVLARVR
jgi:hypothetical protein